ncbi:ATP-binding cassette domain-containing protein [Methanospirillum hungatei]|uniref:ATP-binding cassette domain-containing protein n=1 Tax=Methanospirillum hungatei TaxID=2203 RepID=UPI0026EFF1FE|nr:ATP-binding cassette domain-containing protein [Methanospirillum hungatei]MCA1917408.1 ATP-binding cassette domain-containing protein [Methanospirillum hungatei]
MQSAEGRGTILEDSCTAHVELKNITKYYRYPFGDVIALKSVSFDVHAGEFIAIIGPKGSGKSTLINIIGCMETPTSGFLRILDTDLISIDEKELDKFRLENISLISPLLRLNPQKSLRQILQDRLIFKYPSSCSQEKILFSLTKAGVPQSYWEIPTEELTEEMKLRGSIARALVTDPTILILDEPLKKIDTSSMLEVLVLLKVLNNQGITIIIATEDPIIARRANRQLWLHEGSLMEDKRVKTDGRFVSDDSTFHRNGLIRTQGFDTIRYSGRSTLNPE